MTFVQGLAADIGGTNTRLALVDRGKVLEDTIVRYNNADFATPEDAFDAFLTATGRPVCASAVIAIAAPINGGAIRMTNHSWTFDAKSIGKVLGDARIEFLNDFEALAHSLDRLQQDRLAALHMPDGPALQNATRLVVGAGTGFNASALYAADDAMPARVGIGECGHMTLPVESAAGLRLRDYLARGRTRASVERALSGRGLREIYEWVCLEEGVEPTPYRPAEIAALATSGEDERCKASALHWTELLAKVSGDLALAFMARGGIYLTGGVTRSLRPFLAAPVFLEALQAKGRQTELVSGIPVYLVEDDFAALTGCAARM